MNLIIFKENIDTLLFYDLAQRAAADAYQTEIIHLEQAQQFKRIFTTEQMEKFHKIIKEIRRSFKPERREGPNH